jgi:3-methyladenine DNA glycosylase AlkC
MAEPLKNSFGPEIPRRLADLVSAVHPGFDADGFVTAALDGYEPLELTPRARQVAHALRPCLPSNPEAAIEVVTRAVEPELERERRKGMDGFVYLPLVFFVAEYGLPCFEASMRAQHVLTRLFTAEFSIRAFLTHEPERTLARLHEWTQDPDVHVRRLVSEGTRPRLPWAPRLARFQADPEPVLALLERLKDDPEPYVRRSVANNLNDITKDHPHRVLAVCRRWMAGASPERRAQVRHALRSLVKAGDEKALAILGFEANSPVVVQARIEPAEVHVGDKVHVELTLRNPDGTARAVAVDLRVHFVGASGVLRAKVFKGVEAALEPGETRTARRTISLRQHTTRKHYPGTHRVDLLVNGETRPAGVFQVKAADTRP